VIVTQLAGHDSPHAIVSYHRPRTNEGDPDTTMR
jgi:hypothetical protein